MEENINLGGFCVCVSV